MNDIKRYEFEGRAVTPRVEGDVLLFSFRDVATLCEFANERGARRVFQRNKAEFTSDEVTCVNLTPMPGRRAYSAMFLTPLGLYHFAMLCGTEVGPRFRAWVVATFLRPHLSGAKVVPADRLAALEAALAALLEDRKADRKLIEQLGALAATSIGHAGKMLSTFARSPEAKAYRDARIQEGKDRKAIERANRILPLLDGANGNGRG